MSFKLKYKFKNFLIILVLKKKKKKVIMSKNSIAVDFISLIT